MPMLHIVNKSPFEKNAFESCLAHAKAGSTILLLEDGVYAATKGTKYSKMLEEAMADKKVYALTPDADARGIRTNLLSNVQLVDYNGFVDLVTENDTVQSWL